MNHPKYNYQDAQYDIRIFVQWTERGVWFNSLAEDFQGLLCENTILYGPPDIIEFRDRSFWINGENNVLEL